MSDVTYQLYIVVPAPDADRAREALAKLQPGAALERHASADGSHVAFGPKVDGLDAVLGQAATVSSGDTYTLPCEYTPLDDDWFAPPDA